MEWSRYNMLFKSKNNGWLLYNSGSNSFVQMDESTAELIKRVKDNPNMDFAENPDLYFKLRLGGFIVEDGKDGDLVRIIKMKRLTENYAGNRMLLTIAPTKECNFACEYCFEHNKLPSTMTDKTEDKLVKFIKKHNLINEISITWFGGEPLLEFERIKSLNTKIEALGKKYSAILVTNGYNLSKEVVDSLGSLKVSSIQITIDGSKDTHDKRRFLVGGGPTYETILENIDALMQSDWGGRLNVRVNIDSRNVTEFVDVYNNFSNRYPQKTNRQLNVYPGFVDDNNSVGGCFFDSDDKGRFLIELSQLYGINTVHIFPNIMMGGCSLTYRNAYVVGPDGEIYKCLRDIGKKKEIIGSIYCLTNWDVSLMAEGMIGASYLDDKNCENCLLFPVCDGGCPKMRAYSVRDGVKRNICSYFKNHCKELLEIHYEQKMAGSGGIDMIAKYQ